MKKTPLPEEYSRVTHPERFAPLHNLAEDLVSRLEHEFDVNVERSSGSTPANAVARSPNIISSFTLLPCAIDAAPLTISLTDFPGLHLRFGDRGFAAFPTCGCDACAETYESEARRLRFMVDALAAGRYAETRDHADFWDRAGTARERAQIDRQDRTGIPPRDWKAWTRRPIHHK